MNPDKKIIPEDDPEFEISDEEINLLNESQENSVSVDNENLRRSALDITDDEGDLLNEASFDLTGDDLDIPGSEPDPLSEEIGEEDEENSGYSVADTE